MKEEFSELVDVELLSCHWIKIKQLTLRAKRRNEVGAIVANRGEKP